MGMLVMGTVVNSGELCHMGQNSVFLFLLMINDLRLYPSYEVVTAN